MANGDKQGCPHDRWVGFSKWFLGTAMILVPPGIGWIAWITNATLHTQYELRIKTVDRFTSGMFIDVQQELAKKNPDMQWLSAAEIRQIQRRTFPFESVD